MKNYRQFSKLILSKVIAFAMLGFALADPLVIHEEDQGFLAFAPVHFQVSANNQESDQETDHQNSPGNTPSSHSCHMGHCSFIVSTPVLTLHQEESPELVSLVLLPTASHSEPPLARPPKA